ncbi:MAG: type II toxin-antitoxin system death-on-curing family toxin [Candidatus Micrarchaeota archaeon]
MNKRAVLESGDPFAILSEGNLDYAVNAISYKFGNKPDEEAIVLKVAVILDLIAAKGHIFAEGNKRTAYTSGLALLEENGYCLTDIPEKEAVEFMLNVAMGKLKFDMIVEWLKPRIIKKGD